MTRPLDGQREVLLRLRKKGSPQFSQEVRDWLVIYLGLVVERAYQKGVREGRKEALEKA